VFWLHNFLWCGEYHAKEDVRSQVKGNNQPRKLEPHHLWVWMRGEYGRKGLGMWLPAASMAIMVGLVLQSDLHKRFQYRGSFALKY